jgi:pimeloyl-ACP methyl ester carboxylesterase
VAVSEVPFVVVAGTFAPRRGADRYYGPLTAGRSRSAVLALKQFGMANTRESALRVHRYCQKHFGEPVTVAGHSQGALVATWLWLFEPEWYRPPFMLAGPWAGALLCQTWYPLGAALRSMAPESRFLHEVTEAYSSLPANERAWLTSIFATGDRVVQLTTAMVPGATNICVAPQADHLELTRQYPGVIMLDGNVGHSRMPRSAQVREVIDARMAEVHAQRESRN